MLKLIKMNFEEAVLNIYSVYLQLRLIAKIDNFCFKQKF